IRFAFVMDELVNLFRTSPVRVSRPYHTIARRLAAAKLLNSSANLGNPFAETIHGLDRAQRKRCSGETPLNSVEQAKCLFRRLLLRLFMIQQLRPQHF
ncbi:MAG: hypothetical protein WEB89_02360, partial [Balneolales bacterium]